jgi:hypothetical protein
MTYNNLETQVTSVSGTWSGAAISFSTLGLSTSIPFKDQIEVERIFSSSAFTAVKDNITTSDLHKIFLLEKTEYTITGNTISAFSMNGTRSYTLTGGSSSGTAIPIPAISNGDSVIIRRKTLSIDTYVTWAPGTKLTTTQLNLQVGQLLRLNQELMYKLDSEYVRAADLSGSVAPVLAVNNNLNMNSFQILNLATPSSAVGSDSGAGANKGYVDTNFVNKSTAQTGIAGAKTFTGAITLSSTLAVTGAVTLSSTLAVTGAVTLSSGLTVDTNTLVVDATNDRVGIGTGSPLTKLHINVPSTGTTLTGTGRYGGIHLSQNNTNDEFVGITAAMNNNGTQSGLLFQNAGTYGSKIHFLTTDVFDTGMQNRMTLDSFGKVGIGTTSPTTKLHVVGVAGTICSLQSSNASPVSQVMGYIGAGNDVAYSGTTSNHPYSLITNNTAVLNITANGNVGIGSASTGNKLRVAVTGTGTNGIEVINTDTSAYGTIHANGTTGGIASWANGFVLEGVPYSTGNTILSSYTNALTFQTSRAERMRIDTNGNLLLGATSVNTNASFSNGLKLEITTASTDSAVGLYHYGDSDAGNAIRSFRAKGSKASPTAVVSGNLLGSIRGLGYNGSAFTAQTGGMDIVTTENWTTGANGTALAFNTTPNGSAAASMTERMRIGNDGQVTMPANITSTSTTTGTLKVTGGVGISGALYTGSVSVFNDNMTVNGLVQSYGQVYCGSSTTPSAANSAAGICATFSNVNVGIYVVAAGTTAPTFTAPKGSLCINTTATAASNRLYINKDGSTAWAAITAAS